MDLSSLNDAQQEAVSCEARALRVMAGPGSGKTTVITMRVAWLIQVQKLDPRSIVLVTFTKKAAMEMQERLSAIFQASTMDWNPSRLVQVGTFHALASLMLHKNESAADVPHRFSICDATEAKRLIQDLIKSSPPPEGFQSLTPAWIQSWISKHKQGESKSKTASNPLLDEYMLNVEHKYAQELERRNKLDFDDLLVKFNSLLENKPSIADFCQHILIDEFQDTNNLQYELAKKLCGTKAITIVGDPAQSIYGWRMAKADVYKQFMFDFAKCKTISLSQNYRSTPAIVRVSSALLNEGEEYKSRALWTHNKDAHEPLFKCYANSDQEAEFIAFRIAQLMHDTAGQLPFSQIAVLVRLNAMTRAVEQAFARVGIPYQIVGGMKFFDRAEIKDCLAYLKAVVNPNDDSSFMRIINVPKRSLGKKIQEKIASVSKARNLSCFKMLRKACKSRLPEVLLTQTQNRNAKQLLSLIDHLHTASNLSPRAMLEKILMAVRYEEHTEGANKTSRGGSKKLNEKWKNVEELISIIPANTSGQEALKAFLTQLSFSGTSFAPVQEASKDATTLEKSGVTISTIHSAKGLEWAAVFLPGVENGTLPSDAALTSPEGSAEERRLLYVAMTRAKFFLQVSYAPKRRSSFLSAGVRKLSTKEYSGETIGRSVSTLTTMVGVLQKNAVDSNLKHAKEIKERLAQLGEFEKRDDEFNDEQKQLKMGPSDAFTPMACFAKKGYEHRLTGMPSSMASSSSTVFKASSGFVSANSLLSTSLASSSSSSSASSLSKVSSEFGISSEFQCRSAMSSSSVFSSSRTSFGSFVSAAQLRDSMAGDRTGSKKPGRMSRKFKSPVPTTTTHGPQDEQEPALIASSSSAFSSSSSSALAGLSQKSAGKSAMLSFQHNGERLPASRHEQKHRRKGPKYSLEFQGDRGPGSISISISNSNSNGHSNSSTKDEKFQRVGSLVQSVSKGAATLATSKPGSFVSPVRPKPRPISSFSSRDDHAQPSTSEKTGTFQTDSDDLVMCDSTGVKDGSGFVLATKVSFVAASSFGPSAELGHQLGLHSPFRSHAARGEAKSHLGDHAHSLEKTKSAPAPLLSSRHERLSSALPANFAASRTSDAPLARNVQPGMDTSTTSVLPQSIASKAEATVSAERNDNAATIGGAHSSRLAPKRRTSLNLSTNRMATVPGSARKAEESITQPHGCAQAPIEGKSNKSGPRRRGGHTQFKRPAQVPLDQRCTTDISSAKSDKPKVPKLKCVAPYLLDADEVQQTSVSVGSPEDERHLPYAVIQLKGGAQQDGHHQGWLGAEDTRSGPGRAKAKKGKAATRGRKKKPLVLETRNGKPTNHQITDFFRSKS